MIAPAGIDPNWGEKGETARSDLRGQLGYLSPNCLDDEAGLIIGRSIAVYVPHDLLPTQMGVGFLNNFTRRAVPVIIWILSRQTRDEFSEKLCGF